MTNIDLAKSYMIKASKRLRILSVLLEEKAYSDIIREAQEIVELVQKAMLRHAGIDPPKWHDVSDIIIANKDLFPDEIRANLDEISSISKWLRKERELSFYGDIDFIPTEEYTREDALKAIAGARKLTELASKCIP